MYAYKPYQTRTREEDNSREELAVLRRREQHALGDQTDILEQETDDEKKKANENSRDEKTTENKEKWFTFNVPVSQDLDAKESHIKIYSFVYKVAEFRAEEILKEKLKNHNSQSYSSLWKGGSFTEFTEEDVKREYKAFSFSYTDLLKYASYTIEVDEKGEKVKPEGFDERRKWFDSLANGTPQQQETRRNIFRKADQRFKEVTGKDTPKDNSVLIELYWDLIDEEILNHWEGTDVEFGDRIKIENYWERKRTNEIWNSLNEQQQKEYEAFLDNANATGNYGSATYEESLKSFKKNYDDWYKIVNEILENKESKRLFEFIRDYGTPNRLRFISAWKKVKILNLIRGYDLPGKQMVAEKLIKSMGQPELDAFFEALTKDNCYWFKVFEKSSGSYDFSVIKLIEKFHGLEVINTSTRKKLLSEMTKEIHDGTALGSEQNIIKVLESTPDSDAYEIIEHLKKNDSRLLKRLQDGMDWSGYEQYSHLLIGLMFSSMTEGVTEEDAIDKQFQTYLGYDYDTGTQLVTIPYLRRSEYGVKGSRVKYSVDFNEKGEIQFSYYWKRGRWSNISGKTEHKYTFDPFEPIRIKFHQTSENLNKSKDDILVVPAIYLLYVDNQDFWETVTEASLFALDILALVSGTSAVFTATSTIGKVVGAAELLYGVSDFLIRLHRNDIYEMEGGEEFLRIWDATTAVVGIYGLTRLVIASPKILRNLGEAWKNFKGKQQLKKQNKALYEQMQKEINAYENQLKNYYDDVNKNQGFAEQATPDGMVKQNTQKPKLEKLDETVETADDLKRTDVDKSEKSGKFEESSLDNVSTAGNLAQSLTGALKTSYNRLISAGLNAIEEGSFIKLFNAENKLVAEIANNKLVFKYNGYGGNIVMVEGKSTAVFGRFNDPIHGGGTKEFIQNSCKVYETGANPNGINILNISDWTWAKNEAWVIESANRGDIIRFISDPTNPTNIFKNGISGERTVTGLEVQTLESLGYTWDASKFQFVK